MIASSSPPGMSSRRHKYLAVADGTPESRLALRFAALAAKRRRRGLLILMVGDPGGAQHWLGVEELLRAETREEAETLLSRLAREIIVYAGITPQTLFREGDAVEETRALTEQDPYIAALVLASSAEGEAGPLVSAFTVPAAAGRGLPIILIPGNMPEREIRALA